MTDIIVINLLPHDATITKQNGETIVYPPSGWIARLEKGTKHKETHPLGFESFTQSPQDFFLFIENKEKERKEFPVQVENTWLIVNTQVLEYLRGEKEKRNDIFAPNTDILQEIDGFKSGAIRNKENLVNGAYGVIVL